MQVNIDEHAYTILKEERKRLRDKGINASFSDAIRSLKERSEKNE